MTYTARDLLDLGRPESAVRWRRLRRARRMRLNYVAAAIGCSRHYLAQLETGEHVPTGKRRSRVLEALDAFYRANP